jgi:hypothetical protein
MGDPGVPARVLARVARLDFDRPSTMRIFLLILAAAADAGGDAVLSIADLACGAGLSKRTVNFAVSELASAGLVARPGRGRFSVPILWEAGSSRPGCPFTPRQESVVRTALYEIGRLLRVDPASVVVPEVDAGGLGVEPGTTFVDAFRMIRSGGDRERAFAFVGAVIRLRRSESVTGVRL